MQLPVLVAALKDIKRRTRCDHMPGDAYSPLVLVSCTDIAASSLHARSLASNDLIPIEAICMRTYAEDDGEALLTAIVVAMSTSQRALSSAAVLWRPVTEQ